MAKSPRAESVVYRCPNATMQVSDDLQKKST